MERNAKIALILFLFALMPLSQISIGVIGTQPTAEEGFAIAAYQNLPFDKQKKWHHDNHEVVVSKTNGDMEDEGYSPWWADYNYGKMWLGVEVVPGDDYHIMIGFTGSLSVKLATGFWPAYAAVTVSVVICDSNMNEKDYYTIYHESIGHSDTYADTEAFSYDDKWSMTGGYTLLEGNTYYACVKFQLTLKNAAQCNSYTGSDAASLEVTRISWAFY